MPDIGPKRRILNHKPPSKRSDCFRFFGVFRDKAHDRSFSNNQTAIEARENEPRDTKCGASSELRALDVVLV